MEVERLTASVNVDGVAKATAELAAFDAASNRAAKDRHGAFTLSVDKEGNLPKATTSVGGYTTSLKNLTGAMTSSSSISHTHTTAIRASHEAMTLGRHAASGLTDAMGALGKSTTGGAHAARSATSDFDVLTRPFARIQDMASSAGNAISNFGSGIGDSLGKAGSSLASGFTSVASGGALVLGVIVLIAAVIPLVISLINILAGSLFALAAAIWPVFGLLEALPGVFVAIGAGALAAFAGIHGLMPAIQAQMAVTKAMSDTTYTSTMKARDLTTAQRALTNAERAAVYSKIDLIRAEKAVGLARTDAAKNIRDLGRQAQDAAWAETDAVNALRMAQLNLTTAQIAAGRSGMILSKETDAFTGKVYDVSRTADQAANSQRDMANATIQVQKAQVGLTRAQEDNVQAATDLREAQDKGVEGSDEVVAALRALQDAQDNVGSSAENLTATQEKLVQTIKDIKNNGAAGTSALNAYAAEMRLLSPAGQSFVSFVGDKLLPAWKNVSRAAQEALLPPIQAGLQSVLTQVPAISTLITSLASTLGTSIGNFFTNLSSGSGAGMLTTVMSGAQRTLEDLSRATEGIGTGLLAIGAAAESSGFTAWFTKGIADAFTSWGESMQKMGKDGSLAAWFDQVEKTASTVWTILVNVSTAIGNIGNAANKGLGKSMLQMLLETTSEWVKWTGDPKNQNTMAEWFRKLQEPLAKVQDLIGKVINGFLNIGTNGSPVMDGFSNIITSLSDSMPDIIALLQDAGDLLGPLADTINAIKSLFEWLGKWTPLGQAAGFFGSLAGGDTLWGALNGGSNGPAMGKATAPPTPNPSPGPSPFATPAPFAAPTPPPTKKTTTTTTYSYASAMNDPNKYRALGGSVEKGKSYVIGEKRAEVFTPDVNGRVVSSVPTSFDTSGGNGGGIDAAQMETLITRLLDGAKPNVDISNTFMEKQDAHLLSSELAWSIR